MVFAVFTNSIDNAAYVYLVILFLFLNSVLFKYLEADFHPREKREKVQVRRCQWLRK